MRLQIIQKFCVFLHFVTFYTKDVKKQPKTTKYH